MVQKWLTTRWKANELQFQKIEKQTPWGDPILVEHNSKMAKNGKMTSRRKMTSQRRNVKKNETHNPFYNN